MPRGYSSYFMTDRDRHGGEVEDDYWTLCQMCQNLEVYKHAICLKSRDLLTYEHELCEDFDPKDEPPR